MPAPITKCLIEMKILPEIQWRQTRAVYQNVSLHTCIWQWHFGNRCICTVFHQSAHKTFLQKGAFLIRYIRKQRRHTIHAIRQPCRKQPHTRQICPIITMSVFSKILRHTIACLWLDVSIFFISKSENLNCLVQDCSYCTLAVSHRFIISFSIEFQFY